MDPNRKHYTWQNDAPEAARAKRFLYLLVRPGRTEVGLTARRNLASPRGNNEPISLR